jgi:hypothetical protein
MSKKIILSQTNSDRLVLVKPNRKGVAFVYHEKKRFGFFWEMVRDCGFTNDGLIEVPKLFHSLKSHYDWYIGLDHILPFVKTNEVTPDTFVEKRQHELWGTFNSRLKRTDGIAIFPTHINHKGKSLPVYPLKFCMHRHMNSSLGTLRIDVILRTDMIPFITGYLTPIDLYNILENAIPQPAINYN